ncbi:MAG: type II toxin-antitoxin system HicA family toxin [Candidatus Latescibacter sp.]|nr:type II toxin-antitoxin system HicA family toxin [Candidatus Latescibacter sp.]
MPQFGPIRQRELVECLRRAGFEGPFSGGKHPFMVKRELTITIPNPHGGEIGRELLAKILRQAGLSKEEWEKF